MKDEEGLQKLILILNFAIVGLPIIAFFIGLFVGWIIWH